MMNRSARPYGNNTGSGDLVVPGGYSVRKRVPTVERVLRSCGCREQTMLKKGGCPVIIDDSREL